MTKKEEFLKLIDAVNNQTATPQQKAELKEYLVDADQNEVSYISSLSPDRVDELEMSMRSGINQRIIERENEEETLSIPLYKKYGTYAAAAAVLIALSVGLYLFKPEKQKRFAGTGVKVTHDLSPGGNKAILTLANGAVISLTDAANGKIASQTGATINKAKAGQLVYTDNGVLAAADEYNSIATPKGGQYQIILPDGTRVWLNAASALKYPVAFTGTARKVELTGEAYFEVAKNKAKPFIIHTAKQEVTVLGTHFNINAYADEPNTRTSLLEGSVKVAKLNDAASVMIKPGQAALVGDPGNASRIQIASIDPDEAVAWKNGYFMFDSENLESILRKVARWYDVDITWQSRNSAQKEFSGTISKYSNASQVLKKLELTEAVHFKIEGRKIIVLP